MEERIGASEDGQAPPPYRSAVLEKLVETTTAAAGYQSAARRAEVERDSVDARLWDALRHRMTARRTRSSAWSVEQGARAALDHWTPDEITSWQPPPRPSSRDYASRRRRGASPTTQGRPFAEPALSDPIGLAMARETGARRAIEARAAEAEAEVERLSGELTACRHELARHRQLADELGVAMLRHHDDLATHHRRQTAIAISGEVRDLRRAHQQLRHGAVQEISTMHRWLSEQLGGLQQLVGQSASLAATERWFMQRSLQTQLDTVTREIKSQVSADFRRYMQPSSPSTPPHPPWTQAARGIRSKGTPYPSKQPAKPPQKILEQFTGGSHSRAQGSLGFLESLSSR